MPAGIFVGGSTDFEASEAQEGFSNAEHNAAALILGVTGVELVARDSTVAGDKGSGASGGDAKRMDSFAAQKLTEGRAEDLAAITHAGVGSATGALELELPALIAVVHNLAKVHGGAVTKLAGEVSELVAAVAVSRRLGARRRSIPAESFGKSAWGRRVAVNA